MYFDREEVPVTKKQLNGGKHTYGVRCLRHEYRGDEGSGRHAKLVLSVLSVLRVAVEEIVSLPKRE